MAADEAEDERDEPCGAEAAPARRKEQPQRRVPLDESWPGRVAAKRSFARAYDTGSAFAIKDIASSGKNLTIAGLVKALFKAAIKAITQRDPDAPQPKKKRRRSGGTESRAPLCVARPQPRRIAARGRYATLQPLVAKAAGANVSRVQTECFFADGAWDVFDITGFGYEHGFDDSSAAFDTRSSYLSPGL